MKYRTCQMVLVILSIGALAFSTALSQRHQGQHKGQHGQCAMMQAFDASSEEVITGTVEEIKDHNCAMGMQAVHLVVRSGPNTQEVCLGPAEKVSKLGMTFAKGDTLEITGSEMECHGKNVVVPRQIKKDGEVLTLRGSDGKPKM